MIEHHGPVDHEEPDRRARRIAQVRRRVPVEQGRRLVGEVAHQPAGERRQVREARASKRVGDRDQGVAGRSRATRFERGSLGPHPRSAGRPRRRPGSRPGRRRRRSTDPSARSARPTPGGCRVRRRRPPGTGRPAWRRRRAARPRPGRSPSRGEGVERGPVRSDPEVRSQRSLLICVVCDRSVTEEAPGGGPGLVAIDRRELARRSQDPSAPQGPRAPRPRPVDRHLRHRGRDGAIWIPRQSTACYVWRLMRREGVAQDQEDASMLRRLVWGLTALTAALALPVPALSLSATEAAPKVHVAGIGRSIARDGAGPIAIPRLVRPGSDEGREGGGVTGSTRATAGTARAGRRGADLRRRAGPGRHVARRSDGRPGSEPITSRP